jgi:hypothetical protein
VLRLPEGEGGLNQLCIHSNNFITEKNIDQFQFCFQVDTLFFKAFNAVEDYTSTRGQLTYLLD